MKTAGGASMRKLSEDGVGATLAHISHDQFAFVQRHRLQKYANAKVLYFLSTNSLAELSGGYLPPEQLLCALQRARGQVAFKCGRHPSRK
jgi:hypothetical protein